MTHSSTVTLQASGMCKPPTPDAMAAPDDVDVKGTAPDAADADAEETPPTCLERLKSFYVQNSFMVNVILVICIARAHAARSACTTTASCLMSTLACTPCSALGGGQCGSS